MITVKRGELPQIAEALRAVVALEIPVSGALKVRKIVRAVEPEMQDFSEVKQAIIEKYSSEVEGADGGRKIDPGKTDEANAEFEELLGSDAALDCVALTAADLGDGNVSTSTLLALGELLE